MRVANGRGRFRQLTCRLLCGLLVAGVSALAPASQAEVRRLSIDDLLRLEDFGAAASDPQGRWHVYEQLRPYNQNTDYSFRTYAMGKSGHQLWKYDIRKGEPPSKLPGLDPESHSYLESFSPDGDRLAVMQYSWGDLRLGAYDMVADRFVPFAHTPAFDRSGSHSPVWLSNSELAFSALPAGRTPDATSIRVAAGRLLSASWQNAWTGTVATAIQVRTREEDPDGREPGLLVRADARTGDTRTLAEGLFADLRVSPDGRYLAALAVYRSAPLRPDEKAGLRRRHRLTVIDLESREVIRLAGALDFYPYSLSWSPDSRRLAGFAWSDAGSPATGQFHVVEVDSGKVTAYDHSGLDLVSERERGWLQRPERTVFLGDKLAIYARPVPEGDAAAARFTYRDIRPEGLGRGDWYALSASGAHRRLTAGLSDVSPVLIDARADKMTVLAKEGLFRIDGSGTRWQIAPAELRHIARGTFAVRESVVRPDFRDEALFLAREAGSVVLADLRPGYEDNVLNIPLTGGSAIPLTASRPAGSLLLRREDGAMSVLMVAESDGGPAREVARINAHLDGISLGDWREISYEFEDPAGQSRRISSCILLPPEFDPAHPPPVIVDVYPNTDSACPKGKPQLHFPDPGSPYLWAARGFAYARVATPRIFLRREEGPIAGIEHVIDAGIRAIAKEGYGDPQRVVLHGFSQGGVTALYVAARSGPYRAVIARNGWADMFSHYFGPSGIYTYTEGRFGAFGRYDPVAGSDFGFGRTPFEDPEAYYGNSPVFLAPDIQAPVLLVHSDMDDFPMHQFDEMYGALLRAGKDAWYVRYLGEGHGPSSPANIRDLWDRIDAFLKDAGAVP